MTTITDIKDHLSGMMHAGSALKKVRNLYHALERAATVMNSNVKTIDSERIAALSSLVYDNVYDYPLPTDFGWPIDLRPQGIRDHLDSAARRYAEPFDLMKGLLKRTISIEGKEGLKFLRVNWPGRSPILVDSMNATTGWSVVATASGLKLQKLYKISGQGSLEVDLAATGDGIQKTTLTSLDLTDEDEIADLFVWVRIPSAAALAAITSFSAVWGNDLTTAYWTPTAQTTQADGSAFRVGWNLIRWPWTGATETGTVDPAAIDSIKLTATVTSAVTNLCFDSAVFIVGRDFDLKYYSLYAFQNSAGSYITRPTVDTDTVIYTGTALEIFLEEARKECAAQIEGEDSAFDIRFANARLYGNPDSPDPIMRMGLYAKYRAEFPSQTKRAVRSWANPRNPNFHRR